MTQLNSAIVSKVKDGLIVSLSVAVLFVAGFSGSFTKPTTPDSFPGFHTYQLEGGERQADLIPIGGGDGGGYDGG